MGELHSTPKELARMVPNRRSMRLMVMVYVGASFAMALPRLWAARHATHNGFDAVVADAVNVAI